MVLFATTQTLEEAGETAIVLFLRNTFRQQRKALPCLLLEHTLTICYFLASNKGRRKKTRKDGTNIRPIYTHTHINTHALLIAKYSECLVIQTNGTLHSFHLLPKTSFFCIKRGRGSPVLPMTAGRNRPLSQKHVQKGSSITAC